MNRRTPSFAATLVLICIGFSGLAGNGQLSFGQPLTGPYLGQTPPGDTPQLFVPDQLRSNAEWHWHSALAFTPDGNEFYMDIYMNTGNEGIRTRFMEKIDNAWTDPQTPAFAEGFDTASPSLTNEGNTVYFLSHRQGGIFWKATRTQDSWSTPTDVQIPMPGNLGLGWEVTATNEGTLYFRAEVIGSQDPDIYYTRRISGSYTTPERLGDHVNSTAMEIAPYVDPNDDYLIFSSWRPGGYGWSDLYITFKQTDGSWSTAVNMGEPVNSSAFEGAPYVSPDGLYLFFNSDRHQQWDTNPYWVSAQVIEDLRNAASVEDPRDLIPKGFILNQNYPNPFNPETTISFELSRPGDVLLAIHDLKGRHIRVLASGMYSEGSHTIIWDGKDEYGKDASGGLYFCRIQTGDFRTSRKMMLIR